MNEIRERDHVGRGRSPQGPPGREGIAIRCRPDGTVVRVLRCDFPVKLRLLPGDDIRSLLHRSSHGRLAALLAEAAENAACFDRELHVSAPGEPSRALHFSAALASDGELIVVGTDSRGGVLEFLEGLTSIQNDHVNRLRELSGQLAAGEAAGNEATLDHLTRLNNEMANLQRELARTNWELRQANESKNEALGMAAHDLRNPLSAIGAFASLLLDDGNTLDPEIHTEVLGRIRSASQSMQRLVEELVDFSALEGGKVRLRREDVDVIALIRDNVSLLRPIAGESGIRLVEVLPAGSRMAHVDGAKVEQVVSNLVGNAVKFSEAGSEVTVELRIDGDHFVLCVRDQGPGIPEDQIEDIFEPFRRAPGGAPRQGAGLGLAIVRRIVRAHDGRIDVDSEPGSGAAFTVRIPLRAEAPVR